MIGSIESPVLGQEKEDYQTIALRLENQLQALKRAVAEKDQEIQSKVTERKTFKWIIFILFLIFKEWDFGFTD
jgi:hypothetical protein